MTKPFFDELFDRTLEEFLAEEKERGSEIYRGTKSGVKIPGDEVISPSPLENYVIGLVKAPPVVIVSLYDSNYLSVAERLVEKMEDAKLNVALIDFS